MENTIAFLEEYCDNVMWIDESRKALALRMAKENHWSIEQAAATLKDTERHLVKRFLHTFQGAGNKKFYYCFSEKIFPAGKESKISIQRKYTCQKLVGHYKVVIVPFYDYDYRTEKEYEPFVCEVDAKDHKITVDYFFDHEDMYQVSVYYIWDGEEYLLLNDNIYAVNEDLYALQYYKADFHMHTTYSDGYETPEMTALAAYAYGLEVIAVTDHNNYRGSVAAMERIRELGIDMTVISGEEYSLEYSPMHILALGAPQEINRKYISKAILDTDAAKKLKNSLGNMSCDVNAYTATQLLLDEVRRIGGVSVLAHPLWKPIFPNGHRMDTPESLFLELAKDKRFDGVELVSGSRPGEYSTSGMQAALAGQMLGNYTGIPIIGITDSHRYSTDPICGKHFTVIFSKDRSQDSVLQALRDGRCVAVEMVEGTPQCYGSYRYMKFSQFLINHYFPERDEEKFIEASLLEKKLLCRE